MSIAGFDPGVICDNEGVYQGSQREQKAQEELMYNQKTLEHLHIINMLLDQMGYYDASDEEKKEEQAWETAISTAVTGWSKLCDKRAEILGGCYGADLWAKCPVSQNRVRLESEIPWPDAEEKMVKASTKDPNNIYWLEPHDPRKES